jgi:hypothetical protein
VLAKAPGHLFAAGAHQGLVVFPCKSSFSRLWDRRWDRVLSSQLFVVVPVTILLNRSGVNGTFLPDREASDEQQYKAFDPKNIWPQEC